MGWRNTLSLGSEEPLEDERPRFWLTDNELPMPSFVVPNTLTLGAVDDRLRLPPGSVMMGYSSFWVVWDGPTAGERALKEIVDMFDGCLQKQANGDWLLLGAS